MSAQKVISQPILAANARSISLTMLPVRCETNYTKALHVSQATSWQLEIERVTGGANLDIDFPSYSSHTNEYMSEEEIHRCKAPKYSPCKLKSLLHHMSHLAIALWLCSWQTAWRIWSGSLLTCLHSTSPNSVGNKKNHLVYTTDQWSLKWELSTWATHWFTGPLQNRT